MSDIKLFRIAQEKAAEIPGTASHLEKPLQNLIEKNLDAFLGIRLLASEYSTGKTHRGRIDTLGLDENNCPVILEYKRTASENVINQGLFYLDWLMDHQAEFKLLALEKFDKKAADAIDWSEPRLICIAADFTRYDDHAVQQINRNIELIRYRKFGDDLILLELVNAVSAIAATGDDPVDPKPRPKPKKGTKTSGDKPVAEWLTDLPPAIAPIFDALVTSITSLGDDIQRKDLKLYIAFRRLKNFATLVFQNKVIRLYLHTNPDQHPQIEDFTRDVRNIGHWGTGDLELLIASLGDVEKAQPYILAAYDGGAGGSQAKPTA